MSEVGGGEPLAKLDVDIFGSVEALETLPDAETVTEGNAPVPPWLLTQMQMSLKVEAAVVVSDLDDDMPNTIVVFVAEGGLRYTVTLNPPTLAMLLLTLSKRADPALIMTMAPHVVPASKGTGVEIIGVPKDASSLTGDDGGLTLFDAQGNPLDDGG